MGRPTFTVAEAKEQLDAMIRRKVEARRELVEAAVSAAAPRAVELLAEIKAGRFPRWPELAPLTNGERAAVYQAISAGVAAAGGSLDVD